MNEEDIVSRVKSTYPDAVIDVAGEKCSFELYIVDEAFSRLNTLQRQKSILTLFKDEIVTGELHALSVKTMTPAEQQRRTGLVQLQG